MKHYYLISLSSIFAGTVNCAWTLSLISFLLFHNDKINGRKTWFNINLRLKYIGINTSQTYFRLVLSLLRYSVSSLIKDFHIITIKKLIIKIITAMVIILTIYLSNFYWTPPRHKHTSTHNHLIDCRYLTKGQDMSIVIIQQLNTTDIPYWNNHSCSKP